MKFYYLGKHRNCPNYIGNRAIGFAIVSGKKGDVLKDMLHLPMLVLVNNGRIRIDLPGGESITVGEGNMTATTLPEGTIVTALENTMLLRLVIIGDELDFCQRIVNIRKQGKGGGQPHTLPMIPEVKSIMRQLVGYVMDGLLCCDIHAVKQRELAAVLQAYYRPSELLPFIAPIYNPNVSFYNEIMRLADKFLSIKDMASHMNMSYPSFIRHFREVFKENPLEWQSKIRMKRLTDLVYNTTHTDQEIADKLKFSTVQNMRAFCKARCGKTPTQLREQ